MGSSADSPGALGFARGILAAVRRAAFLDLNGTLVLPVRPAHLSEHVPVPGATDALRRLGEAGFLLPVITVQSGVSRGRFSLDEFLAWFTEFGAVALRDGAQLLGPYVCPHSFDGHCECQKPKPHLYRLAAAEWDIDIPGSVVIGDTLSDLRAARALGCRGVLVRTGWGEGAAGEASASGLADCVAADVAAAAEWVVRTMR
jgi:D-glycero-D-manno-heptose 1,7-bisphosphate phosphatase